MLRRVLFVWIGVLALIALTATSVLAESPHFKKGGTPTCTVTLSGSSATTVCTGSMSGLGNGDVLIDTTVAGSAVYTCTNGGGNSAPGQNKVLIGPSTTPTLIPSSDVKNGNLTFRTNPNTLTAPSTVSASAAGCPNNNWTGTNPQLTVTSITLDISQSGTLLFHCTASDPNGLSGTVLLTC